VAHPRTPSMLEVLSENWWALALRGLLAVLFGFAALFLPLDTLAAVGRVFGVYAILEGVLVVLSGLRGAQHTGVVIAEGASGIVAGLVALAWPGPRSCCSTSLRSGRCSQAFWRYSRPSRCGVRSRVSGPCSSSGSSPLPSG
jgi:uncharacterized membrane protein HdeD (DUF308 family)